MNPAFAEIKRLAWRLRTRHWFRYEPTPLQIRAAAGAHVFTVEVARTGAERNFGLSWRKRLPAMGGMLFLYPDLPVVEMWMQNTFLPLDMVFIGPGGSIDHIEHDLAPHAPGDFSSGRPTLAVLELAGGSAVRLGLQPGDSVVCAALSQAAAERDAAATVAATSLR